MNSGRYILSQVLDLVDRKALSRLVERYNAESRVRHFGISLFSVGKNSKYGLVWWGAMRPQTPHRSPRQAFGGNFGCWRQVDRGDKGFGEFARGRAAVKEEGWIKTIFSPLGWD
jgi:hypothetical protein